MPKLVTLSDEKDFAHYRFRKSFSSKNFRIRVAASSAKYPRFGFIIPKKVMPKVTDRNKIRRRIKVIVTKQLANFASMDILIFPAKTAIRQTFSELAFELNFDFNKLNVWKR